jgi:hypothetical protein
MFTIKHLYVNFKIKPIYIDQNKSEEIKTITRKFYCRFSEEPKLTEQLFKLMSNNGCVLAETSTLKFDEQLDLWEIKFFEECLVLGNDVPVELIDCLFLNKASGVSIYSKQKCQILIEYCDCPINFGVSEIYVQYAQPTPELQDNIIVIRCGMVGIRFCEHGSQSLLNITEYSYYRRWVEQARYMRKIGYPNKTCVSVGCQTDKDNHISVQ